MAKQVKDNKGDLSSLNEYSKSRLVVDKTINSDHMFTAAYASPQRAEHATHDKDGPLATT